MSEAAAPAAAATLARTTARLLALGRWLAAFACGLTVVAAIALAYARSPLLGWLASLVLGVAGGCQALHTEFDAHLFADLARRLDTASAVDSELARLDAALAQLGVRAATMETRPLDARVQGAVRLLRGQAVLAALQAVLTVGLWVVAA